MGRWMFLSIGMMNERVRVYSKVVMPGKEEGETLGAAGMWWGVLWWCAFCTQCFVSFVVKNVDYLGICT